MILNIIYCYCHNDECWPSGTNEKNNYHDLPWFVFNRAELDIIRSAVTFC